MQEKSAGKPSNFVLFMILTFGVIMLHSWYFKPLKPEPKPDKPAVARDDAANQHKPDAEKAKDEKPEKAKPEADQADAAKEDLAADAELEAEEPDEPPVAAGDTMPRVAGPPKYFAIGSADPKDPYRMLVTLNDRGAAVQRIELNSPRYPELMDDDAYMGEEGPERRDGYLAYTGGYLGRVTVDRGKRGKGCAVEVVGHGTPAQKAGLKPGDVIVKVNDKEIYGAAELEKILARTKPGRTIRLDVVRDGKPLAAPLEAKLTRPPMEVVHQENDDPLSFLLTLSKIDKRELPEIEVDPNQSKDKRPDYVDDELEGVNLRKGTWEVVDHQRDRITFRAALPRWGLEAFKTYRLVPIPAGDQADSDYPAYNLVLDVKLQLAEGAAKGRAVAYQLDGPTGLPIEGWWYANKVGISWGAGLRDVVISRNHESPGMVSCVDIGKDKIQNYVWRGEPITYIGVDAQYFSAVIMPIKGDEQDGDLWFDVSAPLRVGRFDEKIPSITNVTCRLRSVTAELAPGGKPLEHSFKVFAGPKRPKILAHYGLENLVYYGWYDWFARPMVWILHFFHNLVGNYGLAILMLTVLVRGLMFPISRKQALGAQKMAQLQPEIKKIHEKYKKDMEARTKAQQELFKKHNYNPLSGCLVMFIQLPIFIGLYRGLMVDVELRGSPLLWSGLRWCSNLSAPDMLFDWHSWMPQYFTYGTGVFAFGPYFNLLPLVTVVLFLVQQKMLMPPPADEQQAMQQNVMKYMMLFMGLLFFKVASGLCVYFIASSLWGVAERKLLPKASKKDSGSPPANKPKRRK